MLWGGCRHAINILTLKEQASFNAIYIPTKLMKHELPVHIEHYANPMVHPVTRETILSYKKLMNDQARYSQIAVKRTIFTL